MTGWEPPVRGDPGPHHIPLPVRSHGETSDERVSRTTRDSKPEHADLSRRPGGALSTCEDHGMLLPPWARSDHRHPHTTRTHMLRDDLVCAGTCRGRHLCVKDGDRPRGRVPALFLRFRCPGRQGPCGLSPFNAQTTCHALRGAFPSRRPPSRRNALIYIPVLSLLLIISAAVLVARFHNG